jgi:hypothetical protein
MRVGNVLSGCLLAASFFWIGSAPAWALPFELNVTDIVNCKPTCGLLVCVEVRDHCTTLTTLTQRELFCVCPCTKVNTFTSCLNNRTVGTFSCLTTGFTSLVCTGTTDNVDYLFSTGGPQTSICNVGPGGVGPQKVTVAGTTSAGSFNVQASAAPEVDPDGAVVPLSLALGGLLLLADRRSKPE